MSKPIEKPKTTDFGYEKVNWDDKQEKVAEVFSSVAPSYDLMNDLMSLGIHRVWKRITIAKSRVKPGDKVLDIAGGTGDLTRLFAEKVKPGGQVTLLDINAQMLKHGKRRLIDEGVLGIDYVQGNAEALPFADNHFDLVSIAFGLRNVTDKAAAIASMARVIKPGGRLFVLEFSKPNTWLAPFYDTYSFSLLPKLGEWIANDGDSYRYLAESIRMHPNQEQLQSLILENGFDECHYDNLTGGIVALHRAYKY